MDRTFVMVKPDGVARGLIGEMVSRFEKKGLRLVAARLEKLPEKRVMEQYREHLEKPFFPSLRHYITSGPVFLMVWRGNQPSRSFGRLSVPHIRPRLPPGRSAVTSHLISAGT